MTKDGIKPQAVSYHVRMKNSTFPRKTKRSKNHNDLSLKKTYIKPSSPRRTPSVENSLERYTRYMYTWCGSCFKKKTVCTVASLRSVIWLKKLCQVCGWPQLKAGSVRERMGK